MSTPNPSASISVGGNVEGSIVVGDNNFVVNNNHGTIVYKEAGPQVRLRTMLPRPPRAPRTFVGRALELEDINHLVQDREPVLIQGAEGIGKTYFLKQSAHGASAQAQSHGVVYVEGIDQAGASLGWNDIQQLLFDALFESDPQLKVSASSARTYLSNTSPLVLLDNLVLSETALESLADLFPQAPILAVSTKPVDSDAFEPFQLKPLQLEEAVLLLVRRARITLDESNLPIAEKICQLLNRMPLALVTVGNVIRDNELDFAQALPALEAIETTTTAPNKAAIERGFQFANSVLSTDERQMMALAAAAPSVSISYDWLERFSGGTAVSQKLEDLHLLQANSPRLRLHPEYASLVLENADINTLRGRLLSLLVAMLKTRSLDFDFVKDELGNILGLLNWAKESHRWIDVITLGKAADPYLTLHGLWDAWKTVLDSVLAAGKALGDQTAQAWALHQLGTRSIGTGDVQDALDKLREALQLRESLGDRTGMAFTQHNLDYLASADPDLSSQLMAPLDEMIKDPTMPDVKVTATAQPDQMKSSTATPGELPHITTPPDSQTTRKWNWPSIPLLAMGIILISCLAAGGLILSGRIQLPQNINSLFVPMASPSPTPTHTPTPTAIPSATPTLTFTPTATETPTPAPTNTPIQSPTPTASLTNTPTLSPTPSSTQTPSSTPTETPSPTPTSPEFLTAAVNVGQANCRYGPSTAYLYADGLYNGDIGEVRGRNFGSTWLLLKLEKNGRFCWAARNTLNLNGDPSSVNVTQPNLPRTTEVSQPTGITAERKGDSVTVTWDQVHVNLVDARGYLLDVTVCQNSFLIQLIIQTDGTSYVFTDESGCAGPSGGKIYTVNTRGYTDPVPITWP